MNETEKEFINALTDINQQIVCITKTILRNESDITSKDLDTLKDIRSNLAGLSNSITLDLPF